MLPSFLYAWKMDEQGWTTSTPGMCKWSHLFQENPSFNWVRSRETCEWRGVLSRSLLPLLCLQSKIQILKDYSSPLWYDRVWWHPGKCVTTRNLGGWFVAFANFPGVNTHTMIGLELPMWYSWRQSWEKMYIIICHKPVKMGSSTPTPLSVSYFPSLLSTLYSCSKIVLLTLSDYTLYNSSSAKFITVIMDVHKNDSSFRWL